MVLAFHADMTSLMMCQSAEDLRIQAAWDGARGDSRAHLLSDLSSMFANQSYDQRLTLLESISPSVMIPEHRLSVLLDEVKDSWISNCLFHNTAASPSLYLDHKCERDDFPTKAVLELKHHKDEVWFLQYSNDGTKLASSSKDTTVIIYETQTYSQTQHLDEHNGSAVTHLAWSPDDTKIVTCCSQPENSARIWDVKVSLSKHFSRHKLIIQTGHCISVITDFTYPCTTAAWSPSGKHIVIGSQDDKLGCGIWNLDGHQIHNFCSDDAGGLKIRANDLAISPDGRRMVVVSESSISVFDFTTYEKLYEWPVDDMKLTSVTISQDSRHMLVSMNHNRIELMEIDSGEIIKTFDGHRQKQFIIRSAFGGADQNFIVSGSEGVSCP